MARANTTGPGVGLIVAGISDLLYCGIYVIWTALPVFTSGFVLLSQIMAVAGVTDAETSNGTVGLSIISALAPIVQLVIYALLGLASLIVIIGGARLIGGGSRGLVGLAAFTAVAVPTIGLLTNTLSFCNLMSCGMCIVGFIGGSAGSLVPLIIALPFAIWAYVVISDEGYGLEADAA